MDAPSQENPKEEGQTVGRNIPEVEMVKKRTMTLNRWFPDAPTLGGQASSQVTPQQTTPLASKQQSKR